MTTLVFSDVHGSLSAARQMVALIERYAPGTVILLGDMLYHGPRNRLPGGYDPGTVCGVLAPYAERIIAIKGNCDSEVDEVVLPFPLAPVFSWVIDGNLRIFATHGHRFGPHNLPPLAPGNVLLSGHTHVPMGTTTPDGIHLCNPGSFAMPKEGSPPCYGLFTDGIFQVLTETGDVYLQLDCRAALSKAGQ
ncbi:MAG: phosphodiesterase [Desulfovibrio sp.]|jgi:putative phosphoesterase|nr:phosphodiesterase [Desulfovibrio sp.]